VGPLEEEREVTLRNGKRVLIRPSKASDVEGLQELFHCLTETDNHSRFFARLRSLPVSRAQHLCNVNDESEMAFVVVVGDQERESVIGNACYYVDPSANMAEVAYMIHPEWQGSGLGKALQERTIEHARGKGLRGFTAEILAQNDKMLGLIKKCGCEISIKVCNEVPEVTTLF
jgi:RimJ/RimL family protein N-acetyltransferase